MSSAMPLERLPVSAQVASNASGRLDKDSLSFQYRFLISLKVGLNTSAEPSNYKRARSMIDLCLNVNFSTSSNSAGRRRLMSSCDG